MKTKPKFKKSSFSPDRSYNNCVGVATKNDKILVANTKKQDSIVEFTKSEWSAFLQGVKAGEFDEFTE